MIYYNKNNIIMKNKITLIILFVASLFTFIGCTKSTTQTVTTLSNLVMSDEFNTDGVPDSKLWSYDSARGPFNDGWGNNE